ncbi:MAG: response regulator transcription factor, partial [Gaiellaceae bacterium]
MELVDRLRPGRRVLVVDDHAGFRRCATALLTAEGFEVVGEAENGAAALALADQLEPELVVLDIQLPDIDGFEVA